MLWAPSIAILVLIAKSVITGANAFDGVTLGLVTRPSLLRTILIASLIGEIVWVSYSINTLSKRFGTLAGSLIVGTFWTLWWVPMAVLDRGIVPELPLPSLFVGMLGVATMCGFVYLRSRSGVAVLLLQIMVNTSFLTLPIAPTNGGPGTYLAFSAAYLFASLMLFVTIGPRPLFRRSQRLSESTR